MSRIYTGQHGQFQVKFSPDASKDNEVFDCFKTKPIRGGTYKIIDRGSVTGGKSDTQRREARTKAWEEAGWISGENSSAGVSKHPATGDIFTASGEKAVPPSGFTWNRRPLVRVDLGGAWQNAGQVRNWTFSNTAETIDTTKLGDDYRQKLPGLKSITGQAQLMYYRDPDDSEGVPSRLFRYFEEQDSENLAGDLEVRFRLRHSQSLARAFEFNCIITNWSMSCAVGEVVTMDVSFEGNGSPNNKNNQL